MLFGARRYSDARAAFQAIVGETSGDDRELAELRIAESDFFLRRYESARDGLKPHLDRASRKAEARFFDLSALRDMGQHDEYVALTRALVTDFPDSSWSEEALNNLGTHYILKNEDELAAQVFAELYQSFPNGARRRARGLEGRLVELQERRLRRRPCACSRARQQAFPRSDYRPSFLYWAARSHGKLDRGTEAVDRLRLVHADYGNSYYGRLAAKQLAGRGDSLPLVRSTGVRIAPAGVRDGSASAHRGPHSNAAGSRPLRRRAERAAIRAAILGRQPGDRCDDGVGVPPEGRAAPRDHGDAARLPAVPHGDGPPAADRDPPGDFPADLLGLDPASTRLRAISIPTSWPRSSRRSPRSIRESAPSPTRGA